MIHAVGYMLKPWTKIIELHSLPSWVLCMQGDLASVWLFPCSDTVCCNNCYALQDGTYSNTVYILETFHFSIGKIRWSHSAPSSSGVCFLSSVTYHCLLIRHGSVFSSCLHWFCPNTTGKIKSLAWMGCSKCWGSHWIAIAFTLTLNGTLL